MIVRSNVNVIALIDFFNFKIVSLLPPKKLFYFLFTDLVICIAIVFNGVVDGEQQGVQSRQQFDNTLVKKLFRQNDFRRDVAHQKSVVRS